MEELERTNEILEQTKKANALKIEKKLKENESLELRKAHGQLLKFEKDLNDMKNKFSKVDENYRKFKVEEMNKNFYLTQLEKDNHENEEKLKKTTVETNQLYPEYDKLMAYNEEGEAKLRKLREDKLKVSEKLKQVEEEHTYLATKHEYLSKTVHLDEDMKKIKIEDLRNIMQNNVIVNETINDLMGRWDQLRKFSRNYE